MSCIDCYNGSQLATQRHRQRNSCAHRHACGVLRHIPGICGNRIARCSIVGHNETSAAFRDWCCATGTPAFSDAGLCGRWVMGHAVGRDVAKGERPRLQILDRHVCAQLLYLPVPANIKLQVKSFLDTVVWRFGDGLAGLTVLLFAKDLRFTPRQISWVNLVLLACWIVAALVARHQYVATLRNNIQQIRIQPERVSVPVLDQFTTNVFAEKLNSHDVNEVVYALNLFEMAQQINAHSTVRTLLDHPSPHVRKKAISVLNNAGDLLVRDQMTKLVRDTSLEVRAEALLYLSRHDQMDPLTYVDQYDDFTDLSIRSATVSFFMRPGESQNPEAARMILDGIVTDLEKPDLTDEVARALTLLGDIAVEALRDRLEDRGAPIEIRREIPEILLRI